MNTHPAIARVMTSKGLPPRSYRYRHTVSFEETNVIGNAYFARYISWQGRCRELFLREYAPEILGQLKRDLRLVTLKVSCEYFAELLALDEVNICMSLAEAHQHRMTLAFDYFLLRDGNEDLVAHGSQEIGCMRKTATELIRCEIPVQLMSALAAFQ
jgi:enediyne biosynthesis thioesterase